ncbi:MAG: hypothetical protein RL695_1323 [Pseudomonadota bacterium]|jgi:hypothetical protein
MRRLGDDTNVVIKYMAAVKAFEFKFLTGKSLFDPQQLQGQKRQEVHPWRVRCRRIGLLRWSQPGAGDVAGG